LPTSKAGPVAQPGCASVARSTIFLLSGENLPETESFCNGVSDLHFSGLQKSINLNANDAVRPGKMSLTFFTINRCAQQFSDFK
jgi:hypothetical protein